MGRSRDLADGSYIADGSVTQADLASGVVGTGPAFSAYSSTTNTYTTSTSLVIPCNVKEFDSGGCFNNTSGTVTLNGLSVPAWSFCPNVAGYYQISGGASYSVSSGGNRFLYVEKNAGATSKMLGVTNGISTNYMQQYGSCIMYLNGTGDYVKIAALQNSGGSLTSSTSQADNYFQAAMVRSA